MSFREFAIAMGKDKRTQARSLQALEGFGYETNIKQMSHYGGECTHVNVCLTAEALTQTLVNITQVAPSITVQVASQVVRALEAAVLIPILSVPKTGHYAVLPSTTGCAVLSQVLESELALVVMLSVVPFVPVEDFKDSTLVESVGNSEKENAVYVERVALLPKEVAPLPKVALALGIYNNVGSPENKLLTDLKAVHSSFLKVIERANFLGAQGLQGKKLTQPLVKPCTFWEKLDIERVLQALKLACGDKKLDVGWVLNAREQYTQAFSQVKGQGLSTLEAIKKTTWALNPEELVGKDALAQIISYLGHILEGSTLKISIKSESNQAPHAYSVGMKDKLVLIDGQTNSIVKKLEEANQRGDFNGVAAHTPLNILIAQLLYHVAN